MSDARAQAESHRKSAKSISRKTGKAVSRSAAALSVRGPLGQQGSITFQLTAPPQLDDERAYELARLQMVGFFYFLTYERAKSVGHYWPGGFYPVHRAIKSDWGNPVHRAFIDQTATWDYRLVLTTANGYFRAMIRRHPDKECWGWAVEWNDSYRLLGYFGDFATAQSLVNKLPTIAVHTIVESPNRYVRYRREVPLAEEHDALFRINDEV